MKKVVLILIILAILGGGAWYFTRSKPGVMTGTPTTKTEEFSGTLAQAMKLGVPMKCDWQTSEGSGESYVKGEDMYVKTMVSGKTGFMLKKGNCVYTWSEVEKQGVKFCQEPTASGATTEPVQPDSGSYKAEGVDMNVQYKCLPDVFSGDRFDLPADVQFTDMGGMMKGLTPNQTYPGQ